MTKKPSQSLSRHLPWQWAVPVFLVSSTIATAHAQGAPEPSSTEPPVSLGTVDVVDSAQAQKRFDSAASHSSVAIDSFTATTPLVHVSEVLAGQAGVVASDRGNYAQDLQVSVRGFGSRSTFGVRGVRILVDGIPASMPDGQGQAATAHLLTASQIDVLRGPLAQLYGNSAGGVLQVTTRNPRPGGGAQAGIGLGSFGQRLAEASFDFGDQNLGGVLGVSHFETDGWRDHSAARRTHLNGKLVAQIDARTRVTGLVNLYDQPLALDPVGLTKAQFQANPRQAIEATSVFGTRKSVGQNQAGLVLDHQAQRQRQRAVARLWRHAPTHAVPELQRRGRQQLRRRGGPGPRLLRRGSHLDTIAAIGVGPAIDANSRVGSPPPVRAPPGLCERSGHQRRPAAQ